MGGSITTKDYCTCTAHATSFETQISHTLKHQPISSIQQKWQMYITRDKYICGGASNVKLFKVKLPVMCDLGKVKQTWYLGAYSAVLQNTVQWPCVAEQLQSDLVVSQSENTAFNCPSRFIQY